LAARLVPHAIIEQRGPCDVAIVAMGSSDGAVREALDILQARGVGVNYMRIRAFPFGKEVDDFLNRHEIVFVVEQHRDAQLRSLLTLEPSVAKTRLRSILHYSGLSISS